jgi:hypothetical protein
MKKAFGSLAVLLLGVGLMGCEAQECDVQTESGETRDGVCLKSLTRFRGKNPIVKEAQWTAGAPITIDGRNGDIEVVQGSSDVVRATFHPVVLLAYDSSDERVNSEFAKLDTEVTGNAGGVTGAVLVKTSRIGETANSLGADFTVEIPPTFDGVLTVEQDNGQTDVDFAGSASAVKVHSDNGGCTITSSPAAIETNFHCENGDLAANISGAPPGAGTRSIRTGGPEVGSGDIGLSFIGVSQPFNVQAQALGGVVNLVNDAARGCTTQTAAAGSKTVSCNGGTQADPTYVVRAERLSDITLTF